MELGKDLLRLNVCVLPNEIHVLKSNPQHDGIRKWGLWEVLYQEHGALMNGISALIKENLEISLDTPPCKDTARRPLSMNQEADPH